MKSQIRSIPFYWSRLAVLGLIAIAYLFVAVSADRSQPAIFGVPFILWSTILIAFAIVAITAIAALAHEDEEDGPTQ